MPETAAEEREGATPSAGNDGFVDQLQKVLEALDLEEPSPGAKAHVALAEELAAQELEVEEPEESEPEKEPAIVAEPEIRASELLEAVLRQEADEADEEVRLQTVFVIRS